MNQFLPCVISLLFTLSSFSQNPTPNSSFENWTQVGNYFVPDGWDNLNASTSILGQLTCVQTTDAHNGSYACKLITKDVVIAIANGIITTGHLITVPPYGVSGGIPYNFRPDSIAGWLKYEPQGNDSTQIEFLLFNSSADSVGKGLLRIGQATNIYSRFSTPIEYYNGDTPDSSRWLISSSNGFSAVDETTLYIDDIELIFNTGIHEWDELLITISPNPATQYIHVGENSFSGGMISIIDERGRIVSSISLTGKSEFIRVDDLPSGIYLFVIADALNQKSGSRKLIVAK